jgi:type I restriction enzyme S subunit
MLDKQRNTGLPVQYLRNINVRWFGFDLSDLQTILLSEDEIQSLSVKDGDLLICEGGEPGRAAVWRGGANNLTFQKALHRLRVAPGIVPELLMFRLRADAASGELAEAFTGTTIKHLTGESLARYRTSIPPAREQRRIVTKISNVVARVDACRARLDRVQQVLKKFREAVLEAAVSGRLTQQWRECHQELAEKWDTTTVGEVLIDLRYGTAVKCSYGEIHGTPVLRIPNVVGGKIDVSDLKFGKLSKEDGRRLSLRQGDILLVRSNGSIDLVGRVAVVPSGFERYSFAGYLIRLRPDLERVIPSYLALVMSGPTVRAHVEITARSTSGVNNLNSEEVRAIAIPLPQLAEQMEIVRLVDEFFALADNLHRQYGNAIAQVERLTPSVLGKAFRGELVPQDPNDEPATEMLEGIRGLSESAKQPRQNVTITPGTGGATLVGGSPRIDLELKIIKRTRTRMAKSRNDEDVKGKPYLATLIRSDGGSVEVVGLFQRADLPIADFYKQLAWEVEKGYVIDNKSSLVAN